VVQLSLDEVRYAPGEPVSVLEAELSPTGTEEDLGRITQALTEEWRLASAPLSKLEHGLGAVEAWDGLANNRPSADERLALARLMGSGRPEQGRAAHAVLLWDAGLRPQTIATIVRLSQPRVLYWLHTFSEERIAAFQALTTGRMTGVAPPTPRRRSKQPDILPDDPMSEAGRKTFLLHFERMLAHEPGTRLGEDIEELHDMRVATRRMRAAVPVFGPYFQAKALKPHLKGLKRTGRALGPVRDLDVFEEKAQRYLSSQPADQAGILEGLLAVWHGERDAARKRMLAYLDSQVYSGFVARFGRFLSTDRAGARDLPAGKPAPYQVRHVAPRLIYARYEEVLAYEPMLDAPAIELLHALRIDFKRLRYTLEFLLPVLGPQARSVIEEVKGMQDHLGDLNDADVATQMLDDLLHEPSELSEHQRRGIGAYRQYRHEEKQQLLRSFPAAWVQFNQPRTRRNLALAVAAL
jgi:CHAD domain-containing protein